MGKTYGILGHMRTSAEAQLKTREKILDASLKEFASHGFEGARMRKIAEKAGVSLGATYNYFKNKDEILGELLVNFFKKREILIRGAINNTSDQELSIQTFLRYLIKDVTQNQLFYRLHMSLLLQPKIFSRIKNTKHPFQEFQARDQKLFEIISVAAKKDLGIDGPLMMVFAVGMITVSLANERTIPIESVPTMLVERFQKK